MVGNPRVTVGVPVFRGEAFVTEALDSIREQTYGGFKVLISVDGVDETSAAACRKFEADRRFSVFVQPARLQWTGNVNWLVDHTDTEFFVFLAQDDRFHPAYLETLVAEADRHTDAPVVYSDIQWFGRHQTILREPTVEGPAYERVIHQLKTCHWTAFRGLRRTKLLQKIEPLVADSYYYFFEDVHWVTQVLNIGPTIRVPTPLLFKRSHQGAVSANWHKWEEGRLRNAWITAWARVLSAALPAARYPGEAREMLRIMVERTALDDGGRGRIARIPHLTVRERRKLATDFVDHLEKNSMHLPILLDAGWDGIRAFALDCIKPGFRRQLRAFRLRRKAKRRNHRQENRSN